MSNLDGLIERAYAATATPAEKKKTNPNFDLTEQDMQSAEPLGLATRFVAQLSSNPDAQKRYLSKKYGASNVKLVNGRIFIRDGKKVRTLDPSGFDLQDLGVDALAMTPELVGSVLGAGYGLGLPGSALGAGLGRAVQETAFNALTQGSATPQEVVGSSGQGTWEEIYGGAVGRGVAKASGKIGDLGKKAYNFVRGGEDPLKAAVKDAVSATGSGAIVSKPGIAGLEEISQIEQKTGVPVTVSGAFRNPSRMLDLAKSTNAGRHRIEKAADLAAERANEVALKTLDDLGATQDPKKIAAYGKSAVNAVSNVFRKYESKRKMVGERIQEAKDPKVVIDMLPNYKKAISEVEKRFNGITTTLMARSEKNVVSKMNKIFKHNALVDKIKKDPLLQIKYTIEGKKIPKKIKFDLSEIGDELQFLTHSAYAKSRAQNTVPSAAAKILKDALVKDIQEIGPSTKGYEKAGELLDALSEYGGVMQKKRAVDKAVVSKIMKLPENYKEEELGSVLLSPSSNVEQVRRAILVAGAGGGRSAVDSMSKAALSKVYKEASRGGVFDVKKASYLINDNKNKLELLFKHNGQALDEMRKITTLAKLANESNVYGSVGRDLSPPARGVALAGRVATAAAQMGPKPGFLRWIISSVVEAYKMVQDRRIHAQAAEIMGREFSADEALAAMLTTTEGRQQMINVLNSARKTTVPFERSRIIAQGLAKAIGFHAMDIESETEQ